jgi:hypothetical protein
MGPTGTDDDFFWGGAEKPIVALDDRDRRLMTWKPLKSPFRLSLACLKSQARPPYILAS